MKRVIIIGGGISGLTVANLLKNRYETIVFEKESMPGGLVRCELVNGSLFHICGGHVFNTKNQKVNDWFWSRFNKEDDFVKADRKSAVCLDDGSFVGYPIENHVWQMSSSIQKGFISDIKKMMSTPQIDCKNFGEFLQRRFGKTLYELYFKPYNAKIWRRDLSEVPLSWLEGKLPMPTPEEMLDANRNKIEEKNFVHSIFYYPLKGGSQFIANNLAKDLNIHYNSEIISIQCYNEKIILHLDNGKEWTSDYLFFCGNIKDLIKMIRGIEIDGYKDEINHLESHGTTAAFCEIDSCPYSWFYQPSGLHDSHRFICTGNFSKYNNAPGKMTCTVEFTDEINKEEICKQLLLMPFHPKYLVHHYSKYTYPIQHKNTRNMISELKKTLSKYKIFLCGRFAEWEYYNMDAAISSAMKTTEQL